MKSLLSLMRNRLVQVQARSCGALRARHVLVSKPTIFSSFAPHYLSSKSTFHRTFSSAEDLADILERELAEENENLEMPPELDELMTVIEKDWKVVDDEAMTRLYRTVGSNKVVLSFHCQDTVDEQPAYDEQEEEQAMPFRFQVLVSKAGKTFVVNCLSSSGEMSIADVALTSDDVESVPVNGISSRQYQGPEFEELAEDLQETFEGYLETELGINGDVAAFVSMYADYREQMSYVEFLKGVKTVVV